MSPALLGLAMVARLLGLPDGVAIASDGVALATDGAASWVAALPPGVPARLLSTPDGLLFASDAGLYRLESHGWSLLLTRGGVADLARDGRSTWVASGAGLYRLPDGAGAARPVHLGAGARVSSVAVAEDGRVWAATAAGLFTRPPDALDFARETDLPAGAVAAVRVAGGQVWAATDGVLWQQRDGAGFRPRLHRLDQGWWELRGALAHADGVLLLVPSGMWRVSDAGERPLELGIGELRGIAPVGEVAWIASARGLFPLPLDRLDTAAPSSAVSGAAYDLAAEPGRLVVATRGGVHAVAIGPPAAPLALAEAERRPTLDLPVLHRAVLRQQGLEAARIETVAERATDAALLPEVRLAFGFDRDHEADSDRDQAFTSGALRVLRDQASSRGDSFDVSLQLVWDLQEHRDPDRAIAVSKERRELVELRDQVLERVNRLYFERVRVLARLGGGQPGAERAELEIRARELAAQLDAWSGGLFSRLDSASPPASRSQP